jgi:hypothetical protein
MRAPGGRQIGEMWEAVALTLAGAAGNSISKVLQINAHVSALRPSPPYLLQLQQNSGVRSLPCPCATT